MDDLSVWEVWDSGCSILLRVGVGVCDGVRGGGGVLADESQHVLPERQLGGARNIAHVRLQGEQEVAVLCRELLHLHHLGPGPLDRPRPLALLPPGTNEYRYYQNRPYGRLSDQI